MSDIENYYINIIEKIEKLVNDSEIDKAIFMLEDELSAPYIPINFQDILEAKLLELNANRKYFSNILRYENFDRDKLLRSIIEQNRINIYAMETFFNRYDKNISKAEFQFFQNILISNEIRNNDKILVVESLVFSEIKGMMNFYNINLNKSFEIDLNNIKSVMSLPLYNEILNIISDLALKEPSVFEMSKNILLSIFYYYYPIIPDFDSKDLAKGIFDYILFSLQGTNLNDNEITKVISRIVKDIF
ncbi:MAG: DUF3196 family protein [Malacoplasma sp.]